MALRIRFALLLSLAAAVIVVTSVLAHAADWRAWERYMESALHALEQGRTSGAEQWLQDAVREAEKQDPKSQQLAQSLTALSRFYQKQGRTKDADAVAQRLAKLVTTPPETDISPLLGQYAKWLRDLGRDADARAVDDKILRLRQVRVGGRSDLLFFNPAAELREYAALLRQHKRDAEAREIELVAAAETRKQLARYAGLRKSIASESAMPVLKWQRQLDVGDEAFEGGLYPEAEGLFKDAVATAETFSTRDARLAYSLALLAIAYAAQGKTDDFTATAQQAMALLEQYGGTTHSLARTTLSMLARAYLRAGFDPAKTLAHLQRSLQILEKSPGPDSPLIGLHAAGIAAAYLVLKQPEQARSHLARALAIAVPPYSEEQLVLGFGLVRVAFAYESQGDYARADAVAQRAEEILTRVLDDPGHPEVVRLAAVRKELRRKAGQPAEIVSLPTTATVPVVFVGNTILVHATVNRSQRVQLIVDTGASVSLIRPIVLLRLGITVPDNAKRERMTVVGGQTVEVAFVRVNLAVGDALVENLEVGVTEAFPEASDVDGLLGADFLRQFRMTLDKAQSRLMLGPLSR